MKDDAITQARFVDYARVATRNAFKLIFEIPLENADKALEVLGGTPVTGKEKWCALALLDPALFEKKGQAEQQPASPPPSPEKVKESTPFLHKPRSQQAGMLLNDPQFRAWWGPDDGSEWNTVEADRALKAQLHIASKRDLDQPGPAADAWDRLVAQFRADTGQSTWERPA